ncbi:hypothetical protein Nepgr_018618 [Nepenthes gracilis]|uniref:Uncharacterized protein n=1 Tax=Nepenthes gracilis TaxID=150966 RepID=A0AAD3STE6_NEPGR|nr:hypothetical protein Nepgr_018618 [Nepenthes gracilis]
MILAQAMISFSPKVVAKVIAVFFLGIVLLGFVAPASVAHGNNIWDLSNGKTGVGKLVPGQIRSIEDCMPSGKAKNMPLEKRRRLRPLGGESVPSPVINNLRGQFVAPPPFSP